MHLKSITLKVNGTPHPVQVDDQELLLDALRERVGVTSAREGCGVGACGACTILAEGKSVSACLANAWQCEAWRRWMSSTLSAPPGW